VPRIYSYPTVLVGIGWPRKRRLFAWAEPKVRVDGNLRSSRRPPERPTGPVEGGQATAIRSNRNWRTIPLKRSTKLATRTYHSTGAVSFSTKGEYGVRLMAQLARRFGTGPASLTDIADEEDLPRAYLEQLVISLRDAELVQSTRGAHGGYELTRPPE